ncbi:MAG TPA: FtsX-like permease family protein [Vicinamibacterales bacterium]|nr:FtsX-like permease family protein [Vicinamibacterales bacterium]
MLVVAELALSVAVTVGALLLVQSFARLAATPLGFDPQDAVTATVSAGDDEARATLFFTELRDRLLRMPDVVDAGVISAVPLVNRPPPDFFTIDGRPVPAPGEPGPIAHYVMAGPGALEALGARLARGRFVSADAPVAVVNETFAERYWPGENPIGRRVRYPTGLSDGRWTSWTPWITVVGLVGDIRSIAPTDPAEPAIYASYVQRPRAAYAGTAMRLVVRRTPAAASLANLRDEAHAIDPRAVVTPPAALAGVLGSALSRPRFLGALMSGFAAVTFAIALVGIYGLVSYGVASRQREFGVRLAIGASRGGIFRLVAFQLVAALGTAVPVGLLGAWVLARWMAALLYGVRAWEPWPYAGVAAAVSLAVLVATAIPARRATRVDPLVALRAE